MDLLLDTQIFIWTLTDSRKLTAEARRTLQRSSRICVSVASIWEIAIKAGIGKLKGDASAFVEAIEESGFQELPITSAHATAVQTLAPHHKDPFDRMLVAQAITEQLQLLTADEMLASYSGPVVLV